MIAMEEMGKSEQIQDIRRGGLIDELDVEGMGKRIKDNQVSVVV